MEGQIKELSVTNSLMDAYLILQDCRKVKTSLALELQVAQRDRIKQAERFEALMNEFQVTLTEIQCQFGIERRLLDLIQPESGRLTDERRPGTNTQ